MDRILNPVTNSVPKMNEWNIVFRIGSAFVPIAQAVRVI